MTFDNVEWNGRIRLRHLHVILYFFVRAEKTLVIIAMVTNLIFNLSNDSLYWVTGEQKSRCFFSPAPFLLVLSAWAASCNRNMAFSMGASAGPLCSSYRVQYIDLSSIKIVEVICLTVILDWLGLVPSSATSFGKNSSHQQVLVGQVHMSCGPPMSCCLPTFWYTKASDLLHWFYYGQALRVKILTKKPHPISPNTNTWDDLQRIIVAPLNAIRLKPHYDCDLPVEDLHTWKWPWQLGVQASLAEQPA